MRYAAGRTFPGASRRDRAKNEPAAPRPIRSYRSTRDLFSGPYGFIEPCRGTTYARGSPTNTCGEGIHCSCQSGEIEPIIGMSHEGGRNLICGIMGNLRVALMLLDHERFLS